jgi:hypothetical protein
MAGLLSDRTKPVGGMFGDLMRQRQQQADREAMTHYRSSGQDESPEDAQALAPGRAMDMVNRGLVGGLLGAPVDIVNLGLGVVGMGSKKPVGGSEWLGDRMQQEGLVSGYRNTAGELVAGLVNPQTIALKAAMLPALAGTFIGKGARTWDAIQASKAKQMADAGVDSRQIWKETGTWKGVDGKWRQEIPDNYAVMRDNMIPKRESYIDLANRYLKEQGVVRDGLDIGSSDSLVPPMLKQEAFRWARMKQANDPIPTAALSDVLQHPAVFEAYPEAGAIRYAQETGKDLRGYFDPDKNIITAGGGGIIGEADKTRSTTLHELQHAIQQREGFARGGSPRSAADDVGQELLKASERIRKIEADPSLFEGHKAIDEAFDASINGRITNDEFYKIVAQHPIVAEYSKLQSFRRDAPRDGDEAYRRLAGEAEARLTQSRMNMTMPERLASYPPDMFDVPADQQIVRGLPDGPALSYADEAKKANGGLLKDTWAGYDTPEEWAIAQEYQKIENDARNIRMNEIYAKRAGYRDFAHLEQVRAMKRPPKLSPGQKSDKRVNDKWSELEMERAGAPMGTGGLLAPRGKK